MTEKRIFGWHGALFPTSYSGLKEITVAQWRKNKEPMQVVSGPIGHTTIHFEAPPSEKVKQEMKSFLEWWNKQSKDLDGIIRAGIAHFWFVTIHPFEDGNGRIARALTDMALAEDEDTGRRLYSLSSQINRERDAYYKILEKCQKDKCDITEWLIWFLELFTSAIINSQTLIAKALLIAKFWRNEGGGRSVSYSLRW